MDDIGSVFWLIVLALGALIFAWRSRSKRNRDRAEDHERWRELTSRIYVLEEAVQILQRRTWPAAEEVPLKSELVVVPPVAESALPSSLPARDIGVPEPLPESDAEASPSVRMAEDWGDSKNSGGPTTRFICASIPVSPLDAPPITFAALVRFELEADWVSAAWAALVFGLLVIAWRSERRVFLYQGLLIAFAVLFRTVLHNFYERSYFPAPFWQSRWITAGAAIALLLIALPFAFQLRKKDEPSEETGAVRVLLLLVQRPEQILFFIAVGLLTALLAVEMRHGMVTVSWGVEGVAVFVLALWLGERSFRLTGLGLLLLCVGKIVLVDVWGLDPRDRYLTFIVLGAALLLVSFLYTRNREALRRYL